jgi:hypothetical protein
VATMAGAATGIVQGMHVATMAGAATGIGRQLTLHYEFAQVAEIVFGSVRGSWPRRPQAVS